MPKFVSLITLRPLYTELMYKLKLNIKVESREISAFFVRLKFFLLYIPIFFSLYLYPEIDEGNKKIPKNYFQ